MSCGKGSLFFSGREQGGTMPQAEHFGPTAEGLQAKFTQGSRRDKRGGVIFSLQPILGDPNGDLLCSWGEREGWASTASLATSCKIALHGCLL